jgi:hypothetical protein
MQYHWQPGTEIYKPIGYKFVGRVLCSFYKFDDQWSPTGPLRIVAQNADGIIHIFAPEQLRQVE